MPSDQRVQAQLVEIQELLPGLGYSIEDITGPTGPQGGALTERDLEEDDVEAVYSITARARGPVFSINLSTSSPYASVTYRLNTIDHLSDHLTETQVSELLQDNVSWDKISEERKIELRREALERVLNNTDPREWVGGAFNLSVYASGWRVKYDQEVNSNGFPLMYRCAKAFFPYSEEITLRRLDEAIDPVIIAGERGLRYLDSSFYIDTEGQPEEYTLKVRH